MNSLGQTGSLVRQWPHEQSIPISIQTGLTTVGPATIPAAARHQASPPASKPWSPPPSLGRPPPDPHLAIGPPWASLPAPRHQRTYFPRPKLSHGPQCVVPHLPPPLPALPPKPLPELHVFQVKKRLPNPGQTAWRLPAGYPPTPIGQALAPLSLLARHRPPTGHPPKPSRPPRSPNLWPDANPGGAAIPARPPAIRCHSGFGFQSCQYPRLG